MHAYLHSNIITFISLILLCHSFTLHYTICFHSIVARIVVVGYNVNITIVTYIHAGPIYTRVNISLYSS